jgi:hypothetical protein
MRKTIILSVILALTTVSSPALADFFALEVDGQAGYTSIEKIQIPNSSDTATIAGGTAGVRGKLEILFINLVLDYQHFFKGAEFMHIGLGADFGIPLGIVEPYIHASLGPMLFLAEPEAFDDATATKLEATMGFQARGGVGLDIPFAGDFLAIGARFTAGYHYITAETGFDYSIMGYLGLRI